MPERTRVLVCSAAFLTLAAVILWPAPLGGELLSASATFVAHGPFPAEVRASAPPDSPILSDSMQQFEPWQQYAADVLARTGRLPLWKDTNLCGAPLVGNAQSALLWPPNLVALLLGAPAEAAAWIALLKLVVAGFGTWLLGRHLGMSALAAFLAGAVFAFGGFHVLNLLHPHTSVACLLPWLVLYADRAALQPTAWRVVLLALVAALQHALAGRHRCGDKPRLLPCRVDPDFGDDQVDGKREPHGRVPSLGKRGIQRRHHQEGNH